MIVLKVNGLSVIVVILICVEMIQFKAHESGILGMEWIDDKTLITASTDKSLKTWKLSADYCECEIQSQSEVDNDWTHAKQICGIRIHGNAVTVLRLDGSLEVRDLKDLESKSCSQYAGLGHSKGIVDIITGANGSFTTVSYDGKIKSWTEMDSGIIKCLKETNICNASNVQRLKNEAEVIFENKLISSGGVVELEGKIVGVEFGGKMVILDNGQVLLSGADNNLIRQQSLNVSSVFMTASNTNDKLVVQSFDIRIFSKDLKLLFSGALDGNIKITAMALNESGSKLALADDQRRIKVYNLDDDCTLSKEQNQWCAHSARIDTLSWISEDCVASAGVDGNIMFWSLKENKYAPVQIIKAAHSAPINKVIKLKDMIVSVASDSCIKLWHMGVL